MANLSVKFEFGTLFVHRDRIPYGQHLYQLAILENPWFQEFSYNLYRCDAIGLVCDRIYQIDLTEEAQDWTFEELQMARTATLISDPIANTLSIQVNGETIYTLPI